jgi:hypothetical protein
VGSTIAEKKRTLATVFIDPSGKKDVKKRTGFGPTLDRSPKGNIPLLEASKDENKRTNPGSGF